MFFLHLCSLSARNGAGSKHQYEIVDLWSSRRGKKLNKFLTRALLSFSVRLVDEQTEMTEKFLRFVETCLNRLKRPLPVTSKKQQGQHHHHQHQPERPRAFTSQISGTQLQVDYFFKPYCPTLHQKRSLKQCLPVNGASKNAMTMLPCLWSRPVK